MNDEQQRVLALLQQQRHPVPGQVFPSAGLLHAVLEGLIYVVEHTPAALSVDDLRAALLKKRPNDLGLF